jgi:hypothetical protein
LQYDDDKLVPTYGYGGIPSYSVDRKVSHCFSLNGSPDAIIEGGIPAILGTYRDQFNKGLKLYGPTRFSDILKVLIDNIGSWEANGPTWNYQIILIITDGAIHDMQETKDEIVRASYLPISIIIIGVGNSPELVKMEELDGDEVPI